MIEKPKTAPIATRGISDENFSGEFKRFSDELTPPPLKSIDAYKWLRKESGKITDRFLKTPEMALGGIPLLGKEWKCNYTVATVGEEFPFLA